jgi:hypothetical protein
VPKPINVPTRTDRLRHVAAFELPARSEEACIQLRWTRRRKMMQLNRVNRSNGSGFMRQTYSECAEGKKQCHSQGGKCLIEGGYLHKLSDIKLAPDRRKSTQ